jgi:hypothetical protein
MEQVLLLNQSYEPISIIGWKKAITLVALEKVEIVDTEEDELVVKLDYAVQEEESTDESEEELLDKLEATKESARDNTAEADKE